MLLFNLPQSNNQLRKLALTTAKYFVKFKRNGLSKLTVLQQGEPGIAQNCEIFYLDLLFFATGIESQSLSRIMIFNDQISLLGNKITR